jgi:hypothetical protein
VYSLAMRVEAGKRFRMPGWRALASVVAITSALAARDAIAQEIFRWVDDDGAVHYSDTLPEHDAAVTVVEIDPPPSYAYNAAEDPYSILNQAARIHQYWLDLEAARQARVQQRVDARAGDGSGREAPAEYDSYLENSNDYPYYWPASGADYRPGEARDQIYALDTLDLLGQRPASINSGVHQDRVYRSQFLPLVPPAPPPPRPEPPPRPQPR